MDGPGLAYIPVLVLLAGTGAYHDWRYRRLPNVLCLATYAGGIGFAFLLHDISWVATATLHSILALLVGMALFSRGWIGGGDAKFYAALAVWFPLSASWLLILSVSLAGLLLLLIWYPLRRRFAPGMAAGTVQPDFLKLPYGVAIAVGAVAATVALNAA